MKVHGGKSGKGYPSANRKEGKVMLRRITLLAAVVAALTMVVAGGGLGRGPYRHQR